jgi:hypothetical protein
MIQRGGNRNFRYTPNARNTPDASVPPQGIMSAMLPVPLEIGGVPVANADTGVLQPLPISALASALASAPPEQQRAVCFFISAEMIFYRKLLVSLHFCFSYSCLTPRFVRHFRCLVSSCILW